MMPDLSLVNPYDSFDELYKYWLRAEKAKTPFRAVLLSTRSPGLDRHITGFVFANLEELNDMTGSSCWMFTAAPRNSDFARAGVYREISYSVGRLLGIEPGQFPCIVFFDNLIRPKQTVVVSLAAVLSSEPDDAEILGFFRKLSDLLHKTAALPAEKRLPAFHKVVASTWRQTKGSPIGFVDAMQITLSVSEIAKNIIYSLNTLGIKP
jgi:hypothetical protein